MCNQIIFEQTEVRSALGSLFAFFMVGGYMIEYACGPYVSYRNLIIINFVPALLFLPAFSFIPESPYFSLRKGLANKAFESLSWLRTSQTLEAVESEMNEIKVSLMIAENYETFICTLYTKTFT